MRRQYIDNIQMEQQTERKGIAHVKAEVSVAFGVNIKLPVYFQKIDWEATYSELRAFEPFSFQRASSTSAKGSAADAALLSLPDDMERQVARFRSILVINENLDQSFGWRIPTRGFTLSQLSVVEGISRASKSALDKVLGDDHGLELCLDRHEDGWIRNVGADAGARFVALRLVHADSRIRPDGKLARHDEHYTNLHYGEWCGRIPGAPSGASDRIEKALSALGLEAEDEPGWMLCTSGNVRYTAF